MCYHASVGATYKQLEMEYDRPFEGDFPNFSSIDSIVGFHLNGFDYPNIPIITSQMPQKFQFFRWGLIPNWMNDFAAASKFRANTLNAKSETIFEKPSFKSAILSRRCIVPATGFFEWKLESDKSKTPYYIYLNNHKIFSFAGVYEYWYNSAESKTYQTFSLITTTANEFMENIHNTKNRMPLVLNKEQEVNWLKEDLKLEEISSILNAKKQIDFEAYTISNLIVSKSQNNNVPEVIAPFNYDKRNLFS